MSGQRPPKLASTPPVKTGGSLWWAFAALVSRLGVLPRRGAALRVISGGLPSACGRQFNDVCRIWALAKSEARTTILGRRGSRGDCQRRLPTPSREGCAEAGCVCLCVV
ncbi:unnamed protein product [Danaus chrysippus]|uniref:(African queen) hypothetical protein n=1 Tax=Danaus chrysippus TaxID=151541 RepID=A0A8J2R049_9NEOP|nr:unnamed protein product [Danaus chrysippus]